MTALIILALVCGCRRTPEPTDGTLIVVVMDFEVR